MITVLVAQQRRDTAARAVARVAVLWLLGGSVEQLTAAARDYQVAEQELDAALEARHRDHGCEGPREACPGPRDARVTFEEACPCGCHAPETRGDVPQRRTS